MFTSGNQVQPLRLILCTSDLLLGIRIESSCSELIQSSTRVREKERNKRVGARVGQAKTLSLFFSLFPLTHSQMLLRCEKEDYL